MSRGFPQNTIVDIPNTSGNGKTYHIFNLDSLSKCCRFHNSQKCDNTLKLVYVELGIVKNVWGRNFCKLEKNTVLQRKLLWIAHLCCIKGHHAPKFWEVNFHKSHKAFKTCKSFLPRKFPAIQYLYNWILCGNATWSRTAFKVKWQWILFLHVLYIIRILVVCW